MRVLFEDGDMSDAWGTVEAALSKSIKSLELLMPRFHASISFQEIIYPDKLRYRCCFYFLYDHKKIILFLY
jgi:hypothetical protein